MKHSTNSVVLLAVAAAASLPAQEAAPRHELGLTLGRRQPLSRGNGSTGLELQSGTALQANYGYRLIGGDKAALYGEVHFLSTPQQQVSSANTALTRDVATIFLTPGVRVKFMPARAVSPYLAIGAGWALFEHSKLTLGGSPNPAPRTVSHGVVSYGGGVDVKVWRWLGARGELRDFYAGSPSYNAAGLRGGQHNVVVGGGIVLRFR